MFGRTCVLVVGVLFSSGGVAVANPIASEILRARQAPETRHVQLTYGHDAGDEVLKEASARLKSALRGADVIGRLGGEEFAVVLTACPPDGGPYVAERLRILLSVRPMRLADGQTLKVTGSIGGTSVAAGAHCTLEEVLKQADQALYAAKHAGRNRVIWYGNGEPQG